MNELESMLESMSRRRMLQLGAAGLGGIALSGIEAAQSPHPSIVTPSPRAKRIIYLFQAGGPSQVDLFDPKPLLTQHHGKDMFSLVKQAGRLTDFNAKGAIRPVVASKYQFAQHGNNGAWMSELLPHMAKITDDFCTILSTSTSPVNHDPAMTFMQTGHNLPYQERY